MNNPDNQNDANDWEKKKKELMKEKMPSLFGDEDNENGKQEVIKNNKSDKSDKTDKEETEDKDKTENKITQFERKENESFDE